jgi:hypothetical protein
MHRTCWHARTHSWGDQCYDNQGCQMVYLKDGILERFRPEKFALFYGNLVFQCKAIRYFNFHFGYIIIRLARVLVQYIQTRKISQVKC